LKLLEEIGGAETELIVLEDKLGEANHQLAQAFSSEREAAGRALRGA